MSGRGRETVLPQTPLSAQLPTKWTDLAKVEHIPEEWGLGHPQSLGPCSGEASPLDVWLWKLTGLMLRDPNGCGKLLSKALCTDLLTPGSSAKAAGWKLPRPGHHWSSSLCSPAPPAAFHTVGLLPVLFYPALSFFTLLCAYRSRGEELVDDEDVPYIWVFSVMSAHALSVEGFFFCLLCPGGKAATDLFSLRKDSSLSGI